MSSLSPWRSMPNVMLIFPFSPPGWWSPSGPARGFPATQEWVPLHFVQDTPEQMPRQVVKPLADLGRFGQKGLPFRQLRPVGLKLLRERLLPAQFLEALPGDPWGWPAAGGADSMSSGGIVPGSGCRSISARRL